MIMNSKNLLEETYDVAVVGAGIRKAVPEAIFISSVCITGSIITRYFILKQENRPFMGKHRAQPEEEPAM